MKILCLLALLLPLSSLSQPSPPASPVVGHVLVYKTTYFCHEDGTLSLNSTEGMEPVRVKHFTSYLLMAFHECAEVLEELDRMKRDAVYLALADLYLGCISRCPSSWVQGDPSSLNISSPEDIVEKVTLCELVKKPEGTFLEGKEVVRYRELWDKRAECVSKCGSPPSLSYRKMRIQAYSSTHTEIYGLGDSKRDIQRQANVEAPKVNFGDKLGEFLRERPCF